VRTVPVVFVGYADPERLDDVRRYEDEVLALLPDHGAAVVFRGRRVDGADPALPAEVHVLSFPTAVAFDAFLADDRRRALLARHGDVFRERVVVEMDRLA
jgi:uncharacterized protein (DUF1330 family)